MRAPQVARVVTTMLLGAASLACTSRSTVAPPASLVSPAPAAADDCIVFPMRAESVDPSAIQAQLDGHVPSRLPSGFGLLGLWGGSGGGSRVPVGTAMWFDASCRNIVIMTWTSSDPIPEGRIVGRFTAVTGVPATCTRPGPRPCLSYQAQIPPGHVEVDVVGLSPSQADALVRSVG